MDVVGVAVYVLSWILTAMFLKAGLVKVTSRLFPMEHQQTSKRFVLCADVCPTVLFGYTPPPDGYMFVIGVKETLSSILLILPCTNLHNRIYLVFCVLMALAIYTHGVLAQYGKMSEEFVLYASVCPTRLFGYTPPPRGFMFVIGFIQTLAAFLLLLPLTALHPWMNLVLCVMLTLSIYSHSILGNFGKVAIASCIFLACIALYKR